MYARWERLAGALVADALNGHLQATCRNRHDGRNGDVPLPPGYEPPPGTPIPVRRAIAWALAQLGTRYQFGGDCTDSHGRDPSRWCDCSSLVQMAYRAAGITLPRTTYAQVTAGQPVSAPIAGDLVFSAGLDGSQARPGHVGMAISPNLIIEAPHTGAVVRVIRARDWLTSTRRSTHVVAIRRIVTD